MSFKRDSFAPTEKPVHQGHRPGFDGKCLAKDYAIKPPKKIKDSLQILKENPNCLFKMKDQKLNENQ